MDQNLLMKQRELNDRLNRYRNEYYNLNSPSVSDAVYDRLFEELQDLESATGVQMSNSTTNTVGYPAVSKLEKTNHSIPLLSLDKVKNAEDLCRFMGEHQVMFMLKLDGLTIKLTYEGGKLVEAATRGDGDVGEIVTHNTRAIGGIPENIQYEDRLVVTGEAFIRPSDFEQLKTTLVDSDGKPYKNGRNLAAGSVRLFDAGACLGRRLMFMPFNVLEGMEELPRKSERLKALRPLGFLPCKYMVTKRPLTQKETEDGIRQLKEYAADADIPIDGIVITYNDIALSKSCGRTGHHYKDGLAFKFEDDLFQTKLQTIEWTPGRTGEIAPVAIFEPVEIDGCEVSRASLHNLSFIEDLELAPGCRILVSKRNMIIPHVEENLDRGNFSMDAVIPHQCPCCGEPTRIHETSGRGENGEERVIKTLFCDNAACETRRLKQFVHFVSKKAMNIEGLSEATLEKFIQHGFLKNFCDLYHLEKFRDEIIALDGFGEKSYENLLTSVENSRNTTLPKFIYGLGIANVGLSNAKMIVQALGNDIEKVIHAGRQELEKIDGVGAVIADTFASYFENEKNKEEFYKLLQEMHIEKAPDNQNNQILTGKVFVITGSLEHFENRNQLKERIEQLGGRVTGSVTGKTSYLINNDSHSTSSKNKTAAKLGVPVITENEFLEMAPMNDDGR